MTPAEQKIVDRAMRILAKEMREPGQLLNSPHLIKQFLQLQIGAETVEKFGVVLLDSQHQLIEYETLFTGTLNQANVYPREVVKLALHHHAASVVLTHNHPSGNTRASSADIALTRRLQQALELIDVRVLDHIIASGTNATSLAEDGLI